MGLFGIPVAYASVDTLVRKVSLVIINPLIILLFTVALMYFMWGIVQFLRADSEEAKSEGKKHMIYAIIGLFIMIATYSIMQIIINSIGAQGINVRQGTVELPPQ
jgi:uncharacterized membrane protein YidH (DUF202 family)